LAAVTAQVGAFGERGRRWRSAGVTGKAAPPSAIWNEVVSGPFSLSTIE
jgi:hypothetical protein